MSFRPKCNDCGNEADFREYEMVTYIVKYEKIDENGFENEWGKESEADEYYDADSLLFPPMCLVCKSTNVEYDNR